MIQSFLNFDSMGFNFSQIVILKNLSILYLPLSGVKGFSGSETDVLGISKANSDEGLMLA